MRIVLSWLNEFLEHPLRLEEVKHVLTMGGIEVEHVEKLLPCFDQIIAARVTKVHKHPNADRLCIAEIFDGKQTHTVVCGAPDCREGLLTAYAPVGAYLYPSGRSKSAFAIKKSKIRGVDSEGMLCSEKELGISLKADKIMELDSSWKEGDLLETQHTDVALELGLTPNLAHCFSILGVARELVALTGSTMVPFYLNKPVIDISNTAKLPFSVQIEIQSPQECIRYSALIAHNVHVGSSPEWIKKRLESCGFSSINNIVDATNYVMLALGHPLHAFDLNMIRGQYIQVRCAHSGEKLTTLDGVERTLHESILTIADKEGPIALAGLMGGQSSEISDLTRSIFIESACFDPKMVRRGSKSLGLSTEASKRFERGCDWDMTLKALNYVAYLIRETCPDAYFEVPFDLVSTERYPVPVKCRLSRANLVLGRDISLSEAELVFQRLGFQSIWDGSDTFFVSPPSFRHDIHEEIDLIEEISRVLGHHLHIRAPDCCAISQMPHHPLWVIEKQLRRWLISNGLQEFLTCDLISPKMVEIVKDHPIPHEALVKVMNPVSVEQSILRPSLLPGLLKVIHSNIAHQNRDISAFELGRVHFKKGDNYEEPLVFAVVMTGKKNAYHFDSHNADIDLLDLKGVIENLLDSYGWLSHVNVSAADVPLLHPGRQARYMYKELQIGVMGELHPQVLREWDISQKVYFAEFNVHDLLRLPQREAKWIEIPQFPGSERDWTLTVPETISVGDLIACVQNIKSNLLENVSVQAIYRSDKLGSDCKNVTLHFVYRNKQKTFSQEEVDREHERIIEGAIRLLGIRSI